MQASAPAVAFMAPDAAGRPTRLIDQELGGAALQNAQQGLQVKAWTAEVVGNQIRVYPSADPAAFVVLTTVAGVTQCTLAFDQNMNPAVAYVALNQAWLYWYDATLPGYALLMLDADARSPFLSMDDKRDMASSAGRNDMLLFYIRGGRLCYRQQRDRFVVERVLAWLEGDSVSIARAGMGRGLRMQVELVGTTNKTVQGAVLSAWREAVYFAAVNSINATLPLGLAAGDLLFAALVHRQPATPPAGWTLVLAQACARAGLGQTLSLYRKTTVATADSGAMATFTQAGSELLGVLSFAVRATAGSALLKAQASGFVNDLETNTITAPALVAAGPELMVVLASTIEATAAINQPSVAPGLGRFGGAASQCRLGVAYQRRAAGQSNAGRFTFDNGTPVLNGLAAMTLRFGV